MVLLKCCNNYYPKNKKIKNCVDLLRNLGSVAIDLAQKKKKKFNVPITAPESTIIGVLNILDLL